MWRSHVIVFVTELPFNRHYMNGIKKNYVLPPADAKATIASGECWDIPSAGCETAEQRVFELSNGNRRKFNAEECLSYPH